MPPPLNLNLNAALNLLKIAKKFFSLVKKDKSRISKNLCENVLRAYSIQQGNFNVVK